jgi:competence protein ComEA
MKPVALLLTFLAALTSLARQHRAAPPPPRPAQAAPRPGQPLAAGLLFGDRLDLATATVEDLEALPGIGPKRAARIVRQRAAGQPLDTVKGVGPKTLEKLRPYIK